MTTSFGINLVKVVGPKSIPLLFKVSEKFMTDCLCVYKVLMLLTFQYFSVNHSFVFVRGRSDSGARNSFLLHLDDDAEINLGCVFKKRNYLKDTVNIIITDELPLSVNDSIVSYVFCIDAFFPIFLSTCGLHIPC